MKRYFVLTLLMAIVATTSLFAQSGYHMVIEKNNGLKNVFSSNEIKSIYFYKNPSNNSDDILLLPFSGFNSDTVEKDERGDESVIFNFPNAWAWIGQMLYQDLSEYSDVVVELNEPLAFTMKVVVLYSDGENATYGQVGEKTIFHPLDPQKKYSVTQIALQNLQEGSANIKRIYLLKKGEGTPTPIDAIDVVGTWNIVSGSYKRYENDVLVNEENGAFTAPYDRIAFYDNGTMEYLEYSSSRGTWHEDGKGNYYMDGTALVYNGGDWDYFEITAVNNADEMEVVYKFSENKGSTIVEKVYRSKLQRTTESTPRDGEGSDFQGPQRVFGDNQLKAYTFDDKTITYHYDSNGFVSQIDRVNSSTGTSKTYTISYGDQIIVNCSNGNQWTATLESHGFIGTLSYMNEKGNAEQVTFTYNDNDQLTSVDYGDGDVFTLTYSDGNLVSMSNYGTTVTYGYESATQGRIQNQGHVMEYHNIYGIDIDDFNLLYYIGALGKSTNDLPMSGTKSGYTTTGSWTIDNAGRATQGEFNNHKLTWEWDGNNNSGTDAKEELAGSWTLTSCDDPNTPVGMVFTFNSDGTGVCTYQGDSDTFSFTYDSNGNFTKINSDGITSTGNLVIDGDVASGSFSYSGSSWRQYSITLTRQSTINESDLVGTWNIVSGSYKRYENDVLVNEENGAFTAPYDRIAFYDNGTMEYLEYSSSKGTWHEDGKGNYYMDGTALVYNGGDWDYFEITAVNNADEMEVVYKFSENKGSTVVEKV